MTDLKAAVFTVLEGWALPLDARKILETAYYAQPEREWVGLTDEDINKSWEWAQKSSPYGVTRIETFAKSIESKLKEKNT